MKRELGCGGGELVRKWRKKDGEGGDGIEEKREGMNEEERWRVNGKRDKG